MIRILSLQSFSAKKINQLEFYNPQIVFRAVSIVDFISSSTWTCPENVTEVEYLVLAGGGSGGGLGAAYGGGAGGLRLASGYPVTSNTVYTVTVGAGGTGTPGAGANGSSSFFGVSPATPGSADVS